MPFLRPAGDVSPAALVLRLTLAFGLLPHGLQKLFGAFDGPGLAGTEQMFSGLGIPAPAVAAVVVALLETVGSLLLLVGLLVRPVALAMAFSMVVAAFTAHAGGGYFAATGGWEYVVVLAGLALALVATGAGRLSVDGLVAGRRSSARGAAAPAEATAT